MKNRIVCIATAAALAVLALACGKTTAPSKPMSPEETAAFFELVKTGTPETVQAAIAQGADVNVRNQNKETPLMAAAGKNKNTEVIAALIQAGADVNARGPYGGTALMYAAASNGNPEVIIILLKAGADARVKDETGGTALDYFGDKHSDAYRQLQEASK